MIAFILQMRIRAENLAAQIRKIVFFSSIYSFYFLYIFFIALCQTDFHSRFFFARHKAVWVKIL